MRLQPIIENELKLQTVDELLAYFLEEYGRFFAEKPKELLGIAFTKIGYQETMKVAREKGLDVSEYPAELNHLDYLLK